MIVYRTATRADASAIAQLHARSWQQHYRGILSDTYLDNEVLPDRQRVWHERFARPSTRQHIIVAHEEELGGFACAYRQHDPQWGALLDNLHVVPAGQGQGVGRALMRATAQWLQQQSPSEGLYLWVFEANTAARAFYERQGGVCQEKAVVDNPDGSSASVFRYVWTDLSRLVGGRR